MAILGQFRGDLRSEWERVNPVIHEREFILVKETADGPWTGYKIGDGVKKFNELEYASNVSILQILGNSETATLSQKCITDNLLELQEKVFVNPVRYPSSIMDAGSFRYWINIGMPPKNGSICRLTFNNTPSILSIGISNIQNVSGATYVPFKIVGNEVFFVITTENTLYIRVKMTTTLNGTILVDVNGESLVDSLENIFSDISILDYRSMIETPINTVTNVPSENIYWLTSPENLLKGNSYCLKLESSKVLTIKVATDYGISYVVGSITISEKTDGAIFFTLPYDNITNVRITTNGTLENLSLSKLSRGSIVELNVPEIVDSIGSIGNELYRLEDRVIIKNLLSFEDRLDSNTIFGGASNWNVFRTAIASIVNDYVEVSTQGSVIYEGLRYNEISQFKGKKVTVKFEYKNIIGTSRLYLFFSGNLYADLPVTAEWTTYQATVDFLDTFDRIQICTPNGTPTSCTFGVKNINIIDSEKSNLELSIINIESSLESTLKGKKIAVIGDSTSTINGNNAPYITIISSDVGKTIQSWITWYDVWTNTNGTIPTNKTIGGVQLTASMIGTLQSFTPVANDVGKQLGVALNYNSASIITWSEILCTKAGATLLANASWSGSRITQRSSSINSYVLSHAWSDYTIGRCKGRDENGDNINPDVIIIYRGTNDFSYGPYDVIDDYDMSNGIPSTDLEDGVYNFRKGYELTIKKLRETYPEAIVVCCTLNIFKRVIYDVFPTRNGLYTLPQMNNVIREIANTMGCPVIEFDKDGITFENCYPKYISDSSTVPTHPNNNGHLVLGNKAYEDTKTIKL